MKRGYALEIQLKTKAILTFLKKSNDWMTVRQLLREKSISQYFVCRDSTGKYVPIKDENAIAQIRKICNRNAVDEVTRTGCLLWRKGFRCRTEYKWSGDDRPYIYSDKLSSPECEGSYTRRDSAFSKNDPTDPDRGICPKCGRSLKWHRHPSHYYAPWSLPRHNG